MTVTKELLELIAQAVQGVNSSVRVQVIDEESFYVYGDSLKIERLPGNKVVVTIYAGEVPVYRYGPVLLFEKDSLWIEGLECRTATTLHAVETDLPR